MHHRATQWLATVLALQLALVPVSAAATGPIGIEAPTATSAAGPLMASAQRAAQQVAEQAREDEPAMWKAMVEKLESGAFVAVRLKNGSRQLGTVIQAGDETFAFKARTRIPVAAYDIAYRDIATIQRESPPLSPGKKVAIGVGIGGAVFTVLAFVFAATLD